MSNTFRLGLLASVFSTSIFAATVAEAKNNTISLDAVTVVATKTEQSLKDVPAQVSVVDADDAVYATTSKVSDLLKQVPGLEIAGGPRRNGEEIKLRGYDSEGIIITVDGKKQNFNSAHDGRFFVDPALIKRVDVVKGPSSALYGSGGLGGVIAFETKDAKDFLAEGETKGAETSVGWNSANDEWYFGATGFTRGDNFDAVVNVNSRDAENIELGNATEVFSDDDVISGLAKITYFIDDSSSIKFDYTGYFGDSIETNNPQAGPRYTTNINLVDKTNTVHSIGAEYKLNPHDHLDLTARAYYTDTLVEEKYLTASSLNAVGDILGRQTKTFGANLDNITRLGGEYDQALSYGLEFIYDRQYGTDTSAATRNGVPNAEATQFGAYLQDELKIADVLNNGTSELYIIPAVRVDSYRNHVASSALEVDQDEAISPKIAANLKVDETFNIFGSWAQAFRAPTLTELYASGTHFPVFGPYNNTFVANPTLRPETAKTYEVGFGVDLDSVVQKDDEIAFKASRYWTRADDYIEQQISGLNIGNPVLCPAPFIAGTCSGGTTQYVNVAEAKIWGYEATLDYTSKLFNSKITASYVAGKNAITGVHLDSIQPLVVTADINRKWDCIDSTVGYFAKIAAPRDKFDRTRTGTDQYQQNDYVVHNLYVRYEPESLPDLKVDFGVDNILDKTYTETFAGNYEVGRNYKVRLTYKW